MMRKEKKEKRKVKSDGPEVPARNGGSCRRFRLFFFFSLFPFLFSLPSFALKSDRDQPVHIRATSVEINEKTGVAVYRGNVTLTQGSLRIEADHMRVHTRHRRPETIHATGRPVVMRMRLDNHEEELHGRALRLDYHVTRRTVSLYGEVHIRQGGDEFFAEAAHYHLDEERLDAEGGTDGRVHAVIQPRREGAAKP